MEELACPGCQAMRQRVGELEGQVAELTRRLEDALRAGKRQAAPFRKGPPKAEPKTPGRKAGETHGPLWVPKTSSAGRIRRQKRWSALGASCRQTRVADRFPYGW
jgi:hypothetical protein